MIRPAASLVQVCICQKNFIGKSCEVRIDTLSATDKLKYGCELRPCFIGSTCEDRPDGTFVCHCATVNILIYDSIYSLSFPTKFNENKFK